MYVLQQQIVTDWTLKQSSVVIILIVAFVVFGIIIWKVILPRFDKQQEKHEAVLNQQLEKAEKREERFDTMMARRDEIARDTARVMEQVKDNLKSLADKIDRR